MLRNSPYVLLCLRLNINSVRPRNVHHASYPMFSPVCVWHHWSYCWFSGRNWASILAILLSIPAQLVSMLVLAVFWFCLPCSGWNWTCSRPCVCWYQSPYLHSFAAIVYWDVSMPSVLLRILLRLLSPQQHHKFLCISFNVTNLSKTKQNKRRLKHETIIYKRKNHALVFGWAPISGRFVNKTR